MSSPPCEGSRPAAFLDRDGVINVDHGYVYRAEDFEFVPGVVQGMLRLQQLGYALVVITNQSGIARGKYTVEDFERLTAHMRELLAEQGVNLAGVYHCPHLPDGSVAAYRMQCDCRKPGPGMIVRAVNELGLDVKSSILIGDKVSDVQAGRAAGVARCYLVGKGGDDAVALADGAYEDLAACVQGVGRVG